MLSFIPKKSTQTIEKTSTPNDLVLVARLGEAYGLKGWIKLHPFSPYPDALGHAKVWWIAPFLPAQAKVPHSAWQQLHVKNFKPHSDAWVVEFKDWQAGRTDAEKHKGWQVSVPRGAFPKVEQDEVYWVDLLGSTVINQEGLTLGVVKSLLESAAHPVMSIFGELEYLIPFVGVFVIDVDEKNKVIYVDWGVDATA